MTNDNNSKPVQAGLDAVRAMGEPKWTPGPWNVACDSYGKVRHSLKACVYTTFKNESGAEIIANVAARIENWKGAHLIAAGPDMAEALEEFSREYDGFTDGDGLPCPVLGKARAALARARGEQP